MRCYLAVLVSAMAVACGKVNVITDAKLGPMDAPVDVVDGPPDAFGPYLSCKQLASLHPAATSGVYQIDPDGMAGMNMPFNAYCDMTMDGGGWTLAMTYPVGATMWGPMTPGFTQPTSPTDATINMTSLHYSTIADMGVSQLMIMGGDRILKFHYPRTGIVFTSNYRELTEQNAFDATHLN